MLEVTNKNEELNSHSILISYVHGEATTYAQDLKKELLKMGFKKIFLVRSIISLFRLNEWYILPVKLYYLL